MVVGVAAVRWEVKYEAPWFTTFALAAQYCPPDCRGPIRTTTLSTFFRRSPSR